MLQEGDIIELVAGDKVYADIPEHFVYHNRRGSFTLTHHDVVLSGEFTYLLGKYVVTKTAMEGGGCGHGPHDVYPDGHHVFCTSVDGKHKVDFYQSGCFTAMLPNKTAIGKATLTWVAVP